MFNYLKPALTSLFFFTSLSPTFSSAQAADSYIVVEAHSGKVLLQKNQTKRRPVASLTKIATAAIVLDWSKVTGTSLNTTVVVPREAAQTGGSNPMGLRPGDHITLRNALYSALLGSDNVAALTLSTYVGADINMKRSKGSNAISTFVGEMNTLARTLGMNSTNFVNPHGLDTGGTKQRSRQVSYFSAGQKRSFTVKNTNALLGQMSINGLKTGTTPLAGQCLACSSEKPAIVQKIGDGKSRLTPRRLITVTLGSPDRFGQTRNLIAHGWNLDDQVRRANGLAIPGIPTTFLAVPNPLQANTAQPANAY